MLCLPLLLHLFCLKQHPRNIFSMLDYINMQYTSSKTYYKDFIKIKSEKSLNLKIKLNKIPENYNSSIF